MEYTKLYIGSDNDTKVLELDMIKNIMKEACDGYTLIEATGLWQGVEEKTAIIEVYGNFKKEYINILKEKLKQDSILVITSEVNATF